MKKVRRRDLILLIADYYCEFIDPEHKPINDIITGHGDIQININSIYISVRNFNGLFAKDDVKKVIMNEFAENLEAVTSGNLKVTHIGCGGSSVWIDIANAYEVID